MRMPVRRGERRDRSKARAHQRTARAMTQQRELRLQRGDELGRDEPGVCRRVRVLAQAVARRDERNDRRRHVEAVDEVVQDRLHRRKVPVVGPVVDHEQRIARVRPEPRRQVDLDLAGAAQRPAGDLHLHDGARSRVHVRLRPLRHLVPRRVAHGRAPDRAVRHPRVQRVVQLLGLTMPHDLVLVLDA